MKNCLKITQLTSDAQERKLSNSEKMRVYTHLMMCPGCRAFKQNTHKLSDIMRTMKSPEEK